MNTDGAARLLTRSRAAKLPIPTSLSTNIDDDSVLFCKIQFGTPSDIKETITKLSNMCGAVSRPKRTEWLAEILDKGDFPKHHQLAFNKTDTSSIGKFFEEPGWEPERLNLMREVTATSWNTARVQALTKVNNIRKSFSTLAASILTAISNDDCFQELAEDFAENASAVYVNELNPWDRLRVERCAEKLESECKLAEALDSIIKELGSDQYTCIDTQKAKICLEFGQTFGVLSALAPLLKLDTAPPGVSNEQMYTYHRLLELDHAGTMTVLSSSYLTSVNVTTPNQSIFFKTQKYTIENEQLVTTSQRSLLY